MTAGKMEIPIDQVPTRTVYRLRYRPFGDEGWRNPRIYQVGTWAMRRARLLEDRGFEVEVSTAWMTDWRVPS